MTWYIARSGGILAYLLLSTSVVVGVSMSARVRVRWPRFAVEEVHRLLAILTGVFLVLHGGALLLDKVVPTSLMQVVVPFGTSYRPLAVGLGIVAAELMAAVGISNLLRRRLHYRLWRRIHYLTIVAWLAATAHGLLAGTDRRDTWFLALTAAAACAVALAFLVRFAKTSELPAIAGLAVATVVAVLGLAFTPQAKSHPAVTAKGIPVSYEAPVTARVVASTGDPLVSVVGSAGTAALRADLLVTNGVLGATSLQLRFPSGATCRGTVSSVANSGLSGSCGSRHVSISWTIDSSRRIAGSLRLS